MLFNSYAFILAFLPVTLVGFFWIAKSHGAPLARAWLTLASLLFYGWWNPQFVLLLLASIAFNFGAGRAIAGAGSRSKARTLLVAAVAVDLSLLALFKYADFFLSTAGEIAGTRLPMLELVLPLGISFFTFTQIAFLVDVYRGLATEYRLLNYALFVTWFPHLIAGPVIHHARVMPQFAAPRTFRPSWRWIALGLTMFCLGLAKKVLLADSFADYVAPAFGAAEAGVALGALAAWSGMLAFALQLYFDFSGYSDMACGLSLMFGVRLPLNFHSPYKAWNIIEFWRRWHMTLSQFLRDYLYVPLGGNRRGRWRRYLNLMITMLLGGLWHGASWNFVVWGGVHGLFLLVNHGWRAVRAALGARSSAEPRGWRRAAGTGLTFIAVVLAWVPFRAADLPSAGRMLAAALDPRGWPAAGEILAMLGSWPASVPARWYTGLPPTLHDLQSAVALPLLAVGLAIVMLAPNVAQMAGRGAVDREPSRNVVRETTSVRRALRWRPGNAWALAAGLLLGIALLNMSRVSPFLYFQF